MFRVLSPYPLTCLRPTLLAACLAFSVQAQAEAIRLQLPAQSMATSLSQIAQQAKIQLLFDEAQLRNLKAPAIDGEFSAEAAIRQLLDNSQFGLIKVNQTYVVRPVESVTSSSDSIQLDALSVIGTGTEVDSSTVGRSTLTQADIDRHQPNNVPALLATLPGVSMSGSMKPGGQKINIWGLGEAEDVPLTLDGATKSGFERYQQGTIFIEPELIRSIEVEKGPHSLFTGNGGFGGTVHMETKDAPDMLQEGRNSGAMVKYGYASNDHQQTYSGAVFGRTDDGRADALVYLTKRDGGDMKLADNLPNPDNYYPINPKRLPNSALDLDGQLVKVNLHLNDEHSAGMMYSHSESQRWTPFSSATYPNPPTPDNIKKYGYDGALKRFLANRETIDTTWSTYYQYQPLDNRLIDMKLSYSESDTDQTDERDATAFFQAASGGRKMDTDYKDRIVELRNISRFETGALEHAMTSGVEIRKHARNTDMWMPGATYDVPKYNFGHFQPYFMPKGKVDTNSVYLQDAITYGDFTLTPSVRYDHVRNRGEANDAPYYSSQDPAIGHDYSDRTYTGWSPRLSAFWKMTADVAFFVDYSKTWRAPVLDEQYEVQGLGSRTATSVDLDPERITGWRAGNISHFSNVFADHDNVQIRTTLFRNKIDDEIFKATGIGCQNQWNKGGSIATDCKGSGPMSNYRNIGGLTIKGFEVESFYDSSYLFGSLSYSWMTGKHEGAYTNPWGPDVWARDIPPPKWIAVVGVKIPSWDAQVGWQGEFVRKTDRLPSDLYGQSKNSLGDVYYDHYDNDRYNVQGLFANWKPQQPYLKGTEVNLTVDNLFNESYRPALSGDMAYSQGRNAKVSLTRFF